MLQNFLLIVLILLALIIYIIYRLRDPQGNRPKPKTAYDPEQFTLQSIIEFIKKSVNDFTSSDIYDMALDEEDFERRQRMRNELKRALKGCATGNIHDKIYVKEFILDRLLKEYGLTDETADLVIPFHDPDRLSAQDKFEILLHVYKKNHGYHALEVLIEKYGLDRMKECEGELYYVITADDIHEVYKKEIRKPLSFEDKVHVIVQRVYQMYRGLGVIDEIRDMKIDGVSGGVSGVPSQINDIDDELNFYKRMSNRPMDINSVWIMFKGKTIHLEFLSFGSELELKRICQNIYKYKNPGQLNETNGFIVNELYDGSRIVVFRPPFSESWAFFNRKFDATYTDIEVWFQPENAPKPIENTELPIELIKYLMKGARVTAFTGNQATGKTTLMIAAVKFIYGWLTIRNLEMAFEMHLRKRYPRRNIVTVRETESISGQEAMDALKKTDGAVNIVGEVATPIQASWMIQNATVASLFTIFTHHAKDDDELVYSLRKSLIQTGLFQHETNAEDEVVRVLNFNVHLERDASGFRYVRYISEIIPLEDGEYPDNLREAFKEFMKRMTSRKRFTSRVIVEFEDGKYVAKERISQKQVQEMLSHMQPEDQAGFRAFLDKHWKVTAV